ncbi:unnamed protein product [Cuscuta epithymum]|uniref:TOD1/MUCI70 glycosyltransferase-like domain-containing protein n=1 Tax=Cuscuta epithymum TaxID=186058 RepID=A0AAV0DWA0_9ASTE|nr:unnamed protein product [Cuscuta epithymum]CAH9133916.1 unnamed protein product [Cuscuta epithymum]
MKMKMKMKMKDFFPCGVAIAFRDSVDYVIKPNDSVNFTNFSLDYIQREDRTSQSGVFYLGFGGHQILEEREKSFLAINKTIHCGFDKSSEGALNLIWMRTRDT